MFGNAQKGVSTPFAHRSDANKGVSAIIDPKQTTRRGDVKVSTMQATHRGDDSPTQTTRRSDGARPITGKIANSAKIAFLTLIACILCVSQTAKAQTGALYVNDLTQTAPLTTEAAIEAAINTALSSGDATVTGSFTGAATQLNFNIPAATTLTWEADYESSAGISIASGPGAFSLATGGRLQLGSSFGISAQAILHVYGELTGSVNGSIVTVFAAGATITVYTGGIINNTHATGYGIDMLPAVTNAIVAVNGGTVESIGGAAISLYNDGLARINSGTIKSNNQF
jgi:hypothetical protein